MCVSWLEHSPPLLRVYRISTLPVLPSEKKKGSDPFPPAFFSAPSSEPSESRRCRNISRLGAMNSFSTESWFPPYPFSPRPRRTRTLCTVLATVLFLNTLKIVLISVAAWTSNCMKCNKSCFWYLRICVWDVHGGYSLGKSLEGLICLTCAKPRGLPN